MVADEELQATLETVGPSIDLKFEPESRENILRELHRRREEISFDLSRAEAASAEARRNVVVAVDGVSKQVTEGWRRLRFRGALSVLICSAAAGLVAKLFGWVTGKQWLSIWQAPLSSGRLTTFLWLILFCSTLAVLYEPVARRWRTPARRQRLEGEAGIADLRRVSEEADKDRMRQLEEVVREHATEILNTQAGPIFATRLRTAPEDPGDMLTSEKLTRGSGLTEVANDENRIATPVQRALLRMIVGGAGASLGVSGPRGVGKSSLLATLCAANPTIAGKQAIAINTSAPVEYDAREFLLHLFSTLCRQVLRTEGQDALPIAARLAEMERAAWSQSTLRNTLAPLGRFMVATSLALGFAASILGAVQLAGGEARENVASASPADPSKDNSTARSTTRAMTTANTNPRQPNDAKRQTVGSATGSSGETATGNLPSATSMPASQDLGGLLPLLAGSPLFNLAVLLLVIGATILLAEGRYKKLILSRRGSALWGWASRNDIVERALEELRNIAFQRSYTSGWSGGLKVPAGLDIGVSGGLTLAERSQSLPELVERFRSFVRSVTSKYDAPVLIGIDELDKLRSAPHAEAFLDGLKAVFGIPRCFYLISVSEHALAAFERRGIGFRDAFDSALDDVIRVDFLDLTQARALLNRRILRFPDPFTQLCHMLSGGLPRDLIRHARTLLDIADEGTEGRLWLRDAAKLLTERDLDARLRAASVIIRTLKEAPLTSELLVKVASLPTRGTLEQASMAIGELRAYLAALDRLKIDDDTRALLRVCDETTVYYETTLEVRRVCSLVSTEEGWRRADRLGLADQVARTRQALETSVAVASLKLRELKVAIEEAGNTIDRAVNPHRYERPSPQPSAVNEISAL